MIEVVVPVEVTGIDIGAFVPTEINIRTTLTSAPRAGHAVVGHATLMERDADVVIDMPPMA